MKKIFTLFAALAMVMSMSAVNMTGGEELYLTPNSNWLQKDGNGKAPRFAINVYGSGGDAWASMTAVEGESNLYKAVVPNGNWTNVIFCRMNGGNASNGWGNKYNQTGDLTYNGTQNWYTVKEGTWDNGGGTWALYAPEAPKSYKDITITIVANATPKIHYWDGGDKMVGTVWENLPEMTATGEANTYSCTIKDVDEAIGVKYLIKVGEVQSADQQAFDNVTVNFKDLLPQVVLKGTIDNWGDKNKMTVSDDYLSASITLPLTATTYEWKLTVDGNWFGGSKYAITRDKNSVAVADNSDGNGKLTADLAGDYVFTYTYATKTLVVTYPEPEPEYDVMDITMTNLVVKEMEGFLVLTASDETTGLNVMLALNEDGSLNTEFSYMAMVQGWSEVELPIVEGKITKAYNEELATDVYSGLVVVEYMEGKLGLNLTMYAKPVVATDVVVTDATITVETKDDGVGGTYEIINIAANWNGSVLEIEGVEKEFEGFVQIKQVIDEATDDWYIWMCMNGVITTVDNVLTVKGEFTNNLTGDVYNVTISGTLPAVPSALDNLNTTVAPVKMIENGQLIIINNGVQYNAQGAILK